MSKPEVFEVFAVKYATHERSADSNFTNEPDIHDGRMPLDYFVWVVRSANRTIVIDTGFTQAEADVRKRTFLRCPTEGLALIDVDASEVEDVIITHMHYDHAGNFDLFPKAMLHLQDKEMAFVTGREMRNPKRRNSMKIDDVVSMVRKVYADRVEFHEGDFEITPGLSVHLVGGHTAGLQFVRVFTKRGWVVVASDACHLYANMERKNPFPVIYNLDDVFEGYETLKSLADSPDHIVPGHDPLVMERYPAPSLELEGIVIRLDELK